MDRELARMLAGNALRAASDIGNLTILIKNYCTAEEQETLRLAVGSAAYEAGLVAERVFELCHGLKDEFEARIVIFERLY